MGIKNKLTLISRTVVSNFCGSQADNYQRTGILSIHCNLWMKGRAPCLEQRSESALFSPVFAERAKVCQCCAVVSCGCSGLGFMQEPNRKMEIAASYCLE